MAATLSSAAPVDTSVTAGRVGLGITVLGTLFLGFDGITHVLRVEWVDTAMAELGYPLGLSPAIGVTLLVCVAAFAWKRTAPLGAVLLTGYLGGAVATNLRAEKPVFNLVFPVLFAAVLWTAVWLRDARLRSFVSALLHG